MQYTFYFRNECMEILKSGALYQSSAIKIKDETVSKWKHWFHVFQNASTQLFGVIPVHLSGKSKSKVSKKKREKALMSLCLRAHVQKKSINLLWKKFSKID